MEINLENSIYYLYKCKIIHNNTTYFYFSNEKFNINFNEIVKVESKHGLDLAYFINFEREITKDELDNLKNVEPHTKIAEEIDESLLSNSDSINIDFNMLEKKEEINLNEESEPSFFKIDGILIGVASQEDLNKFYLYREKAKEAINIFKKEIEKFNLKMKPINAHYFLDDKKIIFYFISDGRVDFRELVKSMASIFKKRIELHQIGVRDEARFIGGFGICGRKICCNSFLHCLKPISIKMAKIQNAPLNTLKISGYCGRLLCCLSYEYKNYEEIKKFYPEEGTIVKFEGKNCILYEINIIKKSIKLKTQDNNFIKLKLENFKFIQDNIGNIIITNYSFY
ncbi:MAG: hypothetical protein N3A58_04710 [Spirochaetes bacterium]|nr:hypothetical protein [Spirochaetota bacterium]